LKPDAHSENLHAHIDKWKHFHRAPSSVSQADSNQGVMDDRLLQYQAENLTTELVVWRACASV